MISLAASIFLVISLAFLPRSLMAQEQDIKKFRETFAQACGNCHGAEAKYGVFAARLQYEQSGHKKLGNSAYANGDGCQRCHTNEGFLEYVKTGKVDPKSYVVNPSQPGCFTCHDPHNKGDFSLRKKDPVRLANGKVFDMGSGNLCANCHVLRENASEFVKPMKILFDFWGGHHGPETDMLLGTNGYEYPGKKYSSSVHPMVLKGKNGCIPCHMTFPKGRYSFSPALAGHSFNVEAEVHEAPKVNVAGCNLGGCHKEVKQVAGKPYFDIKAKADFDGDGKIETAQEEVLGLLAKFVNKEGTGVLQKINPPMYGAEGKFKRNDVVYPKEVVAATYNYKYVLEDRSKGIHNTLYTVQILMDSLKSLDPKFDDSKRPE